MSHIGSEITVTIDRLAGLGEGAGMWEGKKVFVPHTLAGEKVTAVITHQTQEFLRARLVNVIEPSPERGEAFCPHFATCGGCSLQHLTPPAYRAFKEKMVEEAMRKAGIPAIRPEPLLEVGLGARRRVDWSVAQVGGEIKIGFLENKSHNVVGIDECRVITTQLQQIIHPLRSSIKKLGLGSKIESVQALYIAGHLDVGIVPSENYSNKLEAAFVALGNALGASRISAYHPDGPIVLFEKRAITRVVDGMYIDVPPFCFLQASEVAEERMVKEVMSGLKGCKKIADLFSGIGTYSIPLTLHANVIAFDTVTWMVDSLNHSARTNNLTQKLKAVKRDLFKAPMKAADLAIYDGIVINPPREGAKDQCQEIAKSNIKKVVMVSCNPATFARDARALYDGGYKLTRILGIDQFAYSSHLEIIAHFAKT